METRRRKRKGGEGGGDWLTLGGWRKTRKVLEKIIHGGENGENGRDGVNGEFYF